MRDVPFTPSKRRHGPGRRPHPQQLAKAREIERSDAEGIERIGILSEDAFFAAGVALYAGEGAKADGSVKFANTDPLMIGFFCAWLRKFFAIDEARLRMHVYLHEGLDLEAAESYWSAIAAIPRAQFTKSYRAVADASIRHNKHEHGCAYVVYSCTPTHRRVMGCVRALLSSSAIPG